MPQTIESMAERLKAALAEIGYTDPSLIEVRDIERIEEIGIWKDDYEVPVPKAVAWTAFSVAGFTIACWSCWWEVSGDYDASTDCVDGRCRNLGPRTPPRELVKPRQVSQ